MNSAYYQNEFCVAVYVKHECIAVRFPILHVLIEYSAVMLTLMQNIQKAEF